MFLERILTVRTFVVPFRILQAFGTVVWLAGAISTGGRYHVAATPVVTLLIAFAILLAR